MKFNEEEIPKYKKKRDSSVSKSKDKTKHKHEYVNCLFVDKQNIPYLGVYCKVCGKINNAIRYIETVKDENGFGRLMTKDEIFEKYKDLERIEIENVYSQKYIPIAKQVD